MGIDLLDSEFLSFGPDPVSLIAIVPVMECKMPTVTSVSVTASQVVFTCAVGGAFGVRQWRQQRRGGQSSRAARRPRRVGVRRFPVRFSEDMRRLNSAMVGGHRRERSSPLKSKTALIYCSAAYVD